MESLAVLTSRIGLSRLLNSLETFRDHTTGLNHHAGPALIFFVLVGFVVWCNRAWATRARERDRRLSEARRDAPKCDPSEEDVSSRISSDNSVADRDVSDENTPTPDPCKEDVLPSNPSSHSHAHSDPSEQGIPPSLLSENDVADGDVSESEIPAPSAFDNEDLRTRPCKQDVQLGNPWGQDVAPSLQSENGVVEINPSEQDIPSAGPAEHSVAGSHLSEQDVPAKSPIAPCIDPADENPRTTSQLLDDSERELREIHIPLTQNGNCWLEISTAVLAEGDALRHYNPFLDRKPASPMLEVLRGPMKGVPEDLPVTTEKTVSLCDAVEHYRLLTEGIGQWILGHPRLSEAAFEVQVSALSRMIDFINDGESSVPTRFDGLVELIDLNSELILEQGMLIDKVVGHVAGLMANSQMTIGNLEMMKNSDHLIAMMKVPLGWETLDTKNSRVFGNQEPAQRAQKALDSGQRSGAAASADIVHGVHELSLMFGAGLREKAKPMPEALAGGALLPGQVKDSQRTAVAAHYTEETKRLRKARQDLEETFVQIRRIQSDRETSRARHEDLVKELKSKATNISGIHRRRQWEAHN